ncbi:MAG: hypothetical protein ACR2PO_20965 [Methyloligellaceae bacterium]
MGTTDNYVQALSLAQSLLAERTGSREQSLGRSQGAYENLTWTVLVGQADAATVQPSPESGWALCRISVTVSWSRNRQVRLETLRLCERREKSSRDSL